MFGLTTAIQHYAWGSHTAIPELLRIESSEGPVAEAWFGAHASAPSLCRGADGAARPLTEVIAADPERVLGPDVRARFGDSLPYLLKVIAADSPLSLQVHPHLDQARAGFAEEEAAGIAHDAAHRNYRDRNHKPELVFALTRFEAVCGFRAPRRAAELLEGLEVPLAQQLRALLAARPHADGIQAAFTHLLRPESRAGAQAIAEVAAACAARLAAGSPSPRADRTVVRLQEAFPGDPGVVTSLLLNPVTLQPGDALFVPAGGVHAYLSGVGVEVMASSDNVLRAGLTGKHVDVDQVLRNVDYVAAPPIRIAPERFHGATRVYYAPVDDFELSITRVEDDRVHPLPGRGPRELLCLDGALTVRGEGDQIRLQAGEAAFVPASDGSLHVSGAGVLVQAGVP
ncbi:mannose-6-phosphate isomerase, class I [Cellulomonas sp. RIT-PI-Y]|uniref:mannose-6-phosphate isomerase, class I n=1 Tax=Cellulomonas sp. RIT-PI-Y TaxID=3035297 RepID=UPI0021DA85C0|nr:mannose-6-phosphate isomerase, class I [Cellulomonas sp. RIT-PI-Y]